MTIRVLCGGRRPFWCSGSIGDMLGFCVFWAKKTLKANSNLAHTPWTSRPEEKKKYGPDIKDNFEIKLMVITFKFNNINNPPNEALSMLLKA